MTTVVNRRRTGAYDIDIGRPGPFGNPFRIGRDGDRNEVVEKHRVWFYQPQQAALRGRVRRECRGRVLGCWCAPRPCHGTTLAAYADRDDD